MLPNDIASGTQAAAAARKAAAAAAAEARRRAEAAAKAAEAAAAKAADKLVPEAPAQPSGLAKLAQAAKAAAGMVADVLPWEAAGSAFSKVKEFVAEFAQAEQAKDRAMLEAHAPSFSEGGRQVLEQLAGSGTLSKIDQRWGNLRSQLDAFITGRGDVKVAEAVLDQINNLDAIQQLRENTCTAATLQRAMAEANPAQYFQIATDLLSKGRATLPNGQTLAVSQENQAWVEAQAMGLSAKIDALFQAAVMDLGNGEASYDLASDRSTLETEDRYSSYEGLSLEQASKINDALLGSPTLDQEGLQAYMETTVDRAVKHDQNVKVFEVIVEGVRAQFEAARDDGAPGIFLTLHAERERLEGSVGMNGEYLDHYHMVMLKHLDHQGTATLVDATGNEFTLPADDFANKISMSNQERAEGGIGNTTGTSYSSGSATRSRSR